MTDYPLVSICIPTYNGDKYLAECLDSCLDQSFQDYELVICDDCSTDKTKEIIMAYQKRHAKIRVYENENNLGLVGNWNRCISQAKGEWIKFVFQDDYITKDCLSEFMEQAVPSTFLIVSRRNFVLADHGDKKKQDYYNHVIRTLENSCDKLGNIYFPDTICSAAIKHMGMNFIAEPSLIFFRKKIIGELGDFNANLKQICDLEFVLRISSKYGLTYIPKKICAFRVHEHSTTSENINSRYNEIRYLEPAFYSYLLLFDKHFISLRKNLNALERIKLRVYFRVKVYQAFKLDPKNEQQHVLFQTNSNEFANIAHLKKGSWWVRILSGIF